MSEGKLSIATTTEAPSAHRIDGHYAELRFEESGPLARITLNRPHARNALSMRLSDELTHALERRAVGSGWSGISRTRTRANRIASVLKSCRSRSAPAVAE